MTREDAIEHADALNRRETGDRHWFVREVPDGGWEVVSAAAADLRRSGDLKAVVRAKPEPEQAPDPRPSIIRNIPPFGPS